MVPVRTWLVRVVVGLFMDENGENALKCDLRRSMRQTRSTPQSFLFYPVDRVEIGVLWEFSADCLLELSPVRDTARLIDRLPDAAGHSNCPGIGSLHAHRPNSRLTSSGPAWLSYVMQPEPRDFLPPSDLPDLGGLSLHAPRMAMRRYFLGAGPMVHPAYVLQLNAVRLADCAVTEYSLARETIATFHADHGSPGIHHYNRTSAHFENCIWAIERFIKHAKAIRSAQFVPKELSGLISRKSSFLQSKVESRVMRMRHTLAHLEGEALKGKLPEGSSIALLPLKCGLSVGEHTIAWEQLKQWLTDINASASSLAEYLPPNTPSGEPAGA